MTRSRPAAVAVALCLVIGACASGDDDAAQARASTTTAAAAGATTTGAAPTTTAAPATTTTVAPPAGPGARPATPEEQAAVDAIDRWLELEDQAFTAGTTEAVVDELDALMEEGSVAVQGSLDLAGPVERSSRARIDRLWHPDDGVTGLDVCKIIETPAGEARTAHAITATAGATPFLQNETVYILERDGITCPPDDIIDPVLATYQRWMELNTASALDPTADASELYELSGPEVADDFTQLNTRLAEAGRYESFDPPLHPVVFAYGPGVGEASIVDCHPVEMGRGEFDEAGSRVAGSEPGSVEQVDTTLRRVNDRWRLVTWAVPEDPSWCEERS